jgi:hypothetical protein
VAHKSWSDLLEKWAFCAAACWLGAIFWLVPFFAHASHHYTDKQIDAFAERIGKVFWVTEVNQQTPSFVSSPRTDAAPFQANDNESFEITELVGRKAKDPYYKVKFESGKEAYIRPETFLEAFNATIVTVDPRADERKKEAQATQKEKTRIDWIQTQPWSRAVKEAAIKRQAVPGMNAAEVRMVLGDPARVHKIKGRFNFGEEHWFYADGSIAIFHNGLLNRVERKE